MPSIFTEESYENAIIELFKNMGYDHIFGPDIEDRDYTSPFYEDELFDSLKRINPKVSDSLINDAIKELKNIDRVDFVEKNFEFTKYLQDGISLNYHKDGETRSDIVYLIDYKNVNKNSFVIANQWTFVENSEKRPDIILFINGIPLVIMELKSPVREETNASQAYRQLRNYMKEIPSMFAYNAICVISDLAKNKAGTITSDEDRFMEWKTKDGVYKEELVTSYDTFFEGILEKERLLDILKNFICFSNDGHKRIKILAGYHQYFAVKKAIKKAIQATKTDGKGGVFWHTQGSGKSLSMVFYAHLLQEALESPTIVVLTDRNDLDNQLFLQFSKCRDFLRQDPVQATCRKLTKSSTSSDIGLKNWLAERKANGIIFTTMQKFEESDDALSKRKNIIVMADEAHRGQYGLVEKINEKGEIKVGTARIIRDSLPNATYVGFTGTPIATRDRNTREVFGDYIDIYDMTQSVKDGATIPIYYESRGIHLELDPKILELIDKKYELLALNTEPYIIEKSKKELSKMETILGDDKTISSLVNDIISHYEGNRENLLNGKAMIVAYSRDIAIKIYRKILELRPNWNEKVKVVMTSGNNDPEDWREIIGNKVYKEELANKFKQVDSELKIVIVVDMWLTGFDVPSLATMYVYKPMIGLNLMQAIARVNRVYKDKQGGLVVDYIGIAAALKQAMKEYTKRDNNNFGNPDISKTIYVKFKEKLEVCRDLFHGFKYSKFITGTDSDRAKLITDGTNFITDISKDKLKETFLKEALILHQALSLCSSIVKKEERLEATFFEAVRVFIVRIASDGTDKKLSLKEINEQINELLKHSVKSDGIINIFSDAKEEISLFSAEFLEELSKMKEKNVLILILKKLIAEQISIYKKTNFVKSEKFSEMLQRIMDRYMDGIINNTEAIKEILELAKEIMKGHKEGKDLGLTEEELAFYDALCKPKASNEFKHNKELIKLTRELTKELNKNKTVDWQRKESARAGMRVLIKELLRKYDYPPEGWDDATDIVIKQCEQWVDNEDYTSNE